MRAHRLKSLPLTLLLTLACGPSALPDEERIKSDLDNYPVEYDEGEYDFGSWETIKTVSIKRKLEKGQSVIFHVELVSQMETQSDKGSGVEIPDIAYMVSVLYKKGIGDWSLEKVKVAWARVLDTPSGAKHSKTTRMLKYLGWALLEYMQDKWEESTRSSDFLAAEAVEHVFSDVPVKDGPWPYERVRQILHPSDDFFYMQEVPRSDEWGHPIEFWINSKEWVGYPILIRSPGRDGVFEEGKYSDGAVSSEGYDSDIVWALSRSGKGPGILESLKQ